MSITKMANAIVQAGFEINIDNSHVFVVLKSNMGYDNMALEFDEVLVCEPHAGYNILQVLDEVIVKSSTVLVSKNIIKEY